MPTSYASEEPGGGRPIECYTFTLAPGGAGPALAVVWRATDAASDVTDGAGLRYSATALERERLQASDERAGGTVAVTLERAHPLAARLLAGPLYGPLTVTIRRLQAAALADPTAPFAGRLETWAASDDPAAASLTLTFRSTQGELGRPLPRVTVSRTCPHVLFDERCQVDPALVAVAGTLAAPAGGDSILVVRVAAAALQPDGYYSGGRIEFADGARLFITTHAGAVLTLLAARPAGATTGDAVTLWPGCDRAFATCAAKFANTPHFGGFPYAPERDPWRDLVH